jgi:hypothetical protein
MPATFPTLTDVVAETHLTPPWPREARVPEQRNVRTPSALRPRVPARGSVVASLAVGALALGAFALGALAIGRLAIAALSVRHARIRRLQIDDLDIGHIHVREHDLSLPR